MQKIKLPSLSTIIYIMGICLSILLFICAYTISTHIDIPLFLRIFFFIFVFYSIACYCAMRSNQNSFLLVFFILAVALVVRFYFVSLNPQLSDDLYRYVWDGKVTVSGINPYTYAPDNPKLKHLLDQGHARINHPHLKTIYPPFSQTAFAAISLFSSTIPAYKYVFVFFDIATITIIILLLRLRRLNPCLSLIYAWNPLVIIEFAYSGHLDIMGIFFLMLSILLFTTDRKVSGFAILACSFLSKYLSFLLLPFFVVKKEYRRLIWIFPLIIFLGYLPFASAGHGLFESLKTYASQWEFNSALFFILSRIGVSMTSIRLLLFSSLIIFSVYQGYKQNDLLYYTYLVIGCILIVSPTVHPWYVCWIIPFLCFFPHKAWILFSGLVVGSYWVLIQYKQSALWYLNPSILMVEYMPFYTILILDYIKRRKVIRT